MKDPTIKLFGKRIPLLADGEISGEESVGISGFGGGAAADVDVEEMNTSDFDHPSITGSSEKKEEMQRASTVQQKEEKDSQATEGGSTNQETCPESINENPKTPSMDEETERVETCETENHQQSETMTDSQDKPTLKKPDKIIPCPRCNSMDTKFCYYNNYNVSQPRHFCKSCQRYWTAGGTMRNVPVGAGRRKNKNCGSSQQYRHITISEALEASRTDAQNGALVKCNGTVVSFGVPDGKALSESMASVLNLTEKNTLWNGGTQIGFHKIEDLKMQVPCRVGENGDDHSSGASSLTTEEVGSRSCVPQQEPFMPNFNGFLPPQIQCLPAGVPWPYQWNSSAVPPPQAFYSHPGFPFSFYPPAGFWNNCTIPGTWNVPWMPPTPPPSSSSPTNQKAAINPGSISSTLGKHSRDGDVRGTDNSERLKPEAEPTRQQNSERCIWVPKTLRIDDPEEAAKSSIWATLGIKNDSIISSKGGIFKAFQPKGNNEKNHDVAGADETSPALRANPAALSRSLNFHESS